MDCSAVWLVLGMGPVFWCRWVLVDSADFYRSSIWWPTTPGEARSVLLLACSALQFTTDSWGESPAEWLCSQGSRWPCRLVDRPYMLHYARGVYLICPELVQYASTDKNGMQMVSLRAVICPISERRNWSHDAVCRETDLFKRRRTERWQIFPFKCFIFATAVMQTEECFTARGNLINIQFNPFRLAQFLSKNWGIED